LDRVTAPEKMAPDTIHSTQVDRSAGPYPVSLPSQPMKQWRKPTVVDDMLLGLPDPYHRHAVGTFNTYSWGPTHLSLTDTGGVYNLKGVSLPHTHYPTFSTRCLHFPLRVPPGLQFNQVLSTKSKC
jgi:hypothetical protein